MNKQDFIFTLFDNGEGLTLDQIQGIEESLIDIVPDGLIEDLQETEGMTEAEATDMALFEAREVVYNSLRDCADLLELRAYFKDNYNYDLTDNQVLRLWYLRRD